MHTHYTTYLILHHLKALSRLVDLVHQLHDFLVVDGLHVNLLQVLLLLGEQLLGLGYASSRLASHLIQIFILFLWVCNAHKYSIHLRRLQQITELGVSLLYDRRDEILTLILLRNEFIVDAVQLSYS